MPNIFSGLGYGLRRMGANPLLGVDAASSFLGGYTGGQAGGFQGPGGSASPMGSDPETQSLLLAALSQGKPVSEVPRIPQEGLLKYALSKIGVLSPNVQANPVQMSEESLALQGQAGQKASQFGNIFQIGNKMAETSPMAAQQFYESVAPMVGAPNVDPSMWASTYSRAQLALRKQEETERHNRVFEEINFRRAVTQDKLANARDANQAAQLQATLRGLDLREQQLQAEIGRWSAQEQQAQQNEGMNLIKGLITSGNPDAVAIAMEQLRKLGFAPPVAEAAPTHSGSLGWFGVEPNAPAAPTPTVKVPWK